MIANKNTMIQSLFYMMAIENEEIQNDNQEEKNETLLLQFVFDSLDYVSDLIFGYWISKDYE